MQPKLERKLREAYVRLQAGDPPGAERLCGEILRKTPRNPDALSLLGIALAAQDRHAEAAEWFRQAAAAEPENPAAHLNLGNALKEAGALDQAIGSYELALRLQPGHPEVLNSLGSALEQQGSLDEAIACYRKALGFRPDYAEAHNNLGNALLVQSREEEAIACFRRAVALQPDNAHFHYDLGTALAEQNNSGEAAAQYERALALSPAYADAQYSLAMLQLFRHEFERAWPGYERRLECEDVRKSLRRDAATVVLYERLPRWRGPAEVIAEGVAIWAEQGIGDQVLFSTLIPELVAAGVPFVYEVDRRLLGAYERAFPGSRFVTLGDPPQESLRQARRVLLAGSLPGLFRGSRASFSRQPARLLSALPQRVAHYRQQLAAAGPGLRVALSWRSRRADHLGPRKSVPLVQFAPLLKTDGVHFVDVQYGDTRAERKGLEEAAGLRLQHFDDVDHHDDLEELLAILEACDLLITTSNATAHFAGALGKRTWLLYLADNPPFHYWAHGGSYHSLWYPSVEIITAPHLADWSSLIAHAAARLETVVSGR
jgi:tetratricopeptide (TPR) repeat protein